MADAFKVLVWEGEQSFLVCVFVWEQEGGRGERNGGQLLIYPQLAVFLLSPEQDMLLAFLLR